jgi:hypothetical protein
VDTSIDALHNEWINRFRLAAWSLSEKTEEVFLVSHADEEPDYAPSYKIVGTSVLPKGSGILIDKMALFSRASMNNEVIINHARGFPEKTYWLKSLLMASYPRSDGAFNSNNGAAHVLAEFQNMDKTLFEYCILQGIGVLLMDAMREFVCDYESDDSLVRIAKSYWVFIEETT